MVFAVDEEDLFPADGSDREPLHFGGAMGHDEGMAIETMHSGDSGWPAGSKWAVISAA